MQAMVGSLDLRPDAWEYKPVPRPGDDDILALLRAGGERQLRVSCPAGCRHTFLRNALHNWLLIISHLYA
jgi:hypothetical protein